MRTRKLIAQLCAVIMLACVVTIMLAAVVKADDDDDSDAGQSTVVCGMYDAGVPPAQIPDDLRRNNPRVNNPTLPYQVFHDLQNC